jgi:hypothetical protein
MNGARRSRNARPSEHPFDRGYKHRFVVSVDPIAKIPARLSHRGLALRRLRLALLSYTLNSKRLIRAAHCF